MTTRVSLAELSAAGINLRPAEATAIVAEICRRCHAGELRGVPPPGVIRLTRTGDVVVEGPMTTGEDVAMAAHLLADLLAGADAAPEYRPSGALQLIVVRALGALDLPPYGSLAEFCSALQPFVLADVRETAQTLFHVWERARAASDLEQIKRTALTISDIRRARRATGLSLDDVAAVAEVPAAQLRDLEWGYMRGWRADAEGRGQVVRYARAAGLDEGLVLSVAWPMIEDAATLPSHGQPAAALVPVPAAPREIVPQAPPRTRRRAGRAAWLAAAVAAIMLAVVTGLAMARMRPAPRSEGPAIPVSANVSTPAAAPQPLRASRTRTAHTVSKRPAPTRKPARARQPNILEREIIRFVFR